MYLATTILDYSVHFWDETKNSIDNKLWCLKQLEEDCSAKELYKIMNEEIIDKYSKNLIGFVTDGAPVFSGQIKGVRAMLSDQISGIINIHCLAHCTDLVGKKAYRMLDYDIDSFLTLLVSHFTKSSTNKAKFRDLQKKLDFEPNNVLPLCKTRWLKLFYCIERINKLWDVLTQYFEGILKK